MTDQFNGQSAEDRGEPAPVFRDKRKVDPHTGQPRHADELVNESDAVDLASTDDASEVSAPIGADPDSTAETDQLDEATAIAAQRLEDLQRLQAEFVNFKNRSQREMAAVRERTIAEVLEALMPTLDDIHAAREHGELEGGPFAAIAEKLEAALGRYGFEQFGAIGDEFDPVKHEALMHEPSDEIDVTEITMVMQPGYQLGETVVRPARVGVRGPQ